MQAVISLDILILRFIAGVLRRVKKLNTDLQVMSYCLTWLSPLQIFSVGPCYLSLVFWFMTTTAVSVNFDKIKEISNDKYKDWRPRSGHQVFSFSV